MSETTEQRTAGPFSEQPKPEHRLAFAINDFAAGLDPVQVDAMVRDQIVLAYAERLFALAYVDRLLMQEEL